MVGELKKAIKCYERVLVMDENNEQVVKKCAKLHLKNKNWEKCIELLKHLLTRN